jgi:hypothetical protein
LYVIQIRGDFSCTNSCFLPPGVSTVRGKAITVAIEVSGGSPPAGFTVGSTTYDLSKIGRLHTFRTN